jgi:hypothetical protein
VGHHLGDVQAVDDLAGHRKADQTPAVGGHEVDIVGRDQLGSHGQVALILPVLVVAHDDHLAPLDVFYDFLYRTERHLLRSSRKSLCHARLQEPLHILANNVGLQVYSAALA